MYFLFYYRLKNTDTRKNILGNESKSGNTAHVRILYLQSILQLINKLTSILQLQSPPVNWKPSGPPSMYERFDDHPC